MPISWTVSNDGDRATASGWVERVFASSDETVGNDTLLAEIGISTGLGIGESITRTRNIAVPNLRDGYRIVVQAGMTDSLWKWLASQGWREVTYRPDRRRYCDIPSAFVTELIDVGPDDRAQVLEAAKAEATYRPQVKNHRARSGQA